MTKGPLQCEKPFLNYNVSAVPPAELLRRQIEDCKRQGIELPPTSFPQGWEKANNAEESNVLAQKDAWVQGGDLHLWKWVSPSKKTTCYGADRVKVKQNKGIICYNVNNKNECPSCFFDFPNADESKKSLSLPLTQFEHHARFTVNADEVCTACHVNTTSPFLFSSAKLAENVSKPACKSFSAIGFEMYQVTDPKKNPHELASCATCHTDWNKQFAFGHAYFNTVITPALKTKYMPQGDPHGHDEALKYLEKMGQIYGGGR